MHLRSLVAPRPRPSIERRTATAQRGLVLALALALLTAVAAAGCAQAVSVKVAPGAADPLCASVVLALPQQLADSTRIDTSSQATAAWGDPAAPIVLRCGVDPLSPTTDKCVTATDAAGVSVDWVAIEGPVDTDGAATWTFTTYGREPAIEVTVPKQVTSSSSTSFLVDLGKAIDKTAHVRSCL